MCGILGVLSGDALETKSRLAFFTQALYVDALRGWDSTGVFNVQNNSHRGLFKRAITSADFIHMQQYKDIERIYHNTKFLVGHNRWATKGGINNNNAHPFSFGDITMVHNGTLDNHKDLPGGEQFTVDSEAFVYSMNKIGAVPTLEKVEGALAVIWHDASTDTINICRNEERSLSYAFCKNSDTVLLASEKFMLMWLADRNKLELKSVHSLPVGKIISFSSNSLMEPTTTSVNLTDPYAWYGYGTHKSYTSKGTHKVVPDTKKNTAKNTVQNTVVYLPAEGKKDKVKKQEDRAEEHQLKLGETIQFDSIAFDPYGANKNTGCLQGLYGGLETTLLVEAHAFSKADYKNDTVYQGTLQSIRIDDELDQDVLIMSDVHTDKPDARFHGPGRAMVSEAKFKELSDDGCCWCSGYINPKFSNLVGWLSNGSNQPVCHNCMDDDIAKDNIGNSLSVIN